MIDWATISTEYITSNITYQDLSEKWGVSLSRLAERARNEKWREQRKNYQQNVVKKTIKKIEGKIAKENASRIDRLLMISDDLTALVNQATQEIKESDHVDTYKLRQIIQSIKDLKEIQNTDSQDLPDQISGVVVLPIVEGDIDE